MLSIVTLFIMIENNTFLTFLTCICIEILKEKNVELQ